MKRKLGKKLVLRRETVRELTDAQLQSVAGAGVKSWVTPDTVFGCGGTSRVLPSLSGVTCICPTCGPSCDPGCCP